MRILAYDRQAIQLELTRDDTALIAAACRVGTYDLGNDDSATYGVVATLFEVMGDALAAEGFMLRPDEFEQNVTAFRKVGS